MDNTLKVTNVLSDPTRYHIYQYILKSHKDVSVLEIANHFDIHSNVARLHLSKLEEIKLVTTHFKRTGKGGRPSKMYRLSEEVIELSFPSRDYKTLSSIALEALMELGEVGEQALYTIGKKHGHQYIEDLQLLNYNNLSTKEKLRILEGATEVLGLYPSFTYDEANNNVRLLVNNCPFKEIVMKNQAVVCHMHYLFLKGMFDVLFEGSSLKFEENMFTNNCGNCSYLADLSIV
ncbi:helix-turn-helix transcriptional regulator [Oceanobacillus polygoni]|uniref:ArsR family transcriptional regulator n=1 Tax=Oceanobacillus polygoni TaxID=1235259 RepID=A0A9X0YT76_9BACI|nr:helix-turn-helix domain-containing protein [Oceanobacillus polygoni]MBP2078199.1 putative ArsR family transcriptional regulator [Oceanobacillus polygoni]